MPRILPGWSRHASRAPNSRSPGRFPVAPASDNAPLRRYLPEMRKHPVEVHVSVGRKFSSGLSVLAMTAMFLVACGDSTPGTQGDGGAGAGGTSSGGQGGTSSGGTGGTTSGGHGGTSAGGAAGTTSGGHGGTSAGGAAGTSAGGHGGTSA